MTTTDTIIGTTGPALDWLHAAQRATAQAGLNVACNALHDTRQRLCRWLLTTADRIGIHDGAHEAHGGVTERISIFSP